MPRYAAFLRGASPMNAKMRDLERVFEAAGFSRVKTVLSSGNVVFDAPASPLSALEDVAEAAMKERLGRAFPAIVRSTETLRKLLAADPWAAFRLEPGAKRIVTFLRGRPKRRLELPISQDGAHILAMKGGEVFSAYLPSPRGPVFMALIEKTLGKHVKTRTWDTVRKVAAS